ncbi:hypothetical protein ACNHUS_34600 [Actinomycetes bacterium M1A6_2h]
MSVDVPRRFLRPRYVFHACDLIWVVDESQPVAALFDPETAELVRLASWEKLPPPPPGTGPPTIVGDVGGLWVQNHRDGPLARIDAEGIAHAEFTEGHVLLAAGAAGAWCHTIGNRPPDRTPTNDRPPRPFRPSTILLARPGGGIDHIPVTDAAVVSIEADETWLYVGLEHHPWRRDPAAAHTAGRGSFEARFSSSVVRVPLNGPIPASIGPGTDRLARRQVGYTNEYADQTYAESHHRKRSHDRDLRWHWEQTRRTENTTRIRAYRNDDPLMTVETDQFRVVDGAAAADRLWMITLEYDGGPPRRSVQLMDTDAVVTPVDTASIDITDWCRPLGPPPLDHQSYVAYCLRRFTGMRFSHTTSNVTTTYVGDWPHGQVHISFDHTDYPDLTLIATCNVYDENGTRLDNTVNHILVELGEQAGTRDYPPAETAIGGILWV